MKKVFFIYYLAVMFSCQSGKDKVTQVAMSESFKHERNNFFNHMESAPNAAALLQATTADFNGSLLSNPAIFEQYRIDTFKCAANLGVYLSDLNYCIAYKQSDYASKSFIAAIELSNVIGVNKNIVEFLMDRYDENISESDSLMSIFNELYEKSTSGLRSASKEQLLGVTMAAYQIETLYLALAVIKAYPEDVLSEENRIQIMVPLFKMVMDQQQSIETIILFLQTLGENSDLGKSPTLLYYNEALEDLLSVYERLNTIDTTANARSSYLLNNRDINELSDLVSAIRNKIVDPNWIVGQ